MALHDDMQPTRDAQYPLKIEKKHKIYKSRITFTPALKSSDGGNRRNTK